MGDLADVLGMQTIHHLSYAESLRARRTDLGSL
jgi:hypothetical protein